MKIESELKQLASKNLKELKEIYLQYFDSKPLVYHRDALIGEIGYRMQELKSGGLDANTKAYLRKQCRIDKPITNKPTLPIGASIVRYYRGKNYIVKVRGNGFELDGNIFKSLSAVAQHITGMRLSGYLFFDLTKRKKYDRTKEN